MRSRSQKIGMANSLYLHTGIDFLEEKKIVVDCVNYRDDMTSQNKCLPSFITMSILRRDNL